MTRWIVTLSALFAATVGMGQDIAGSFNAPVTPASPVNPTSIAILVIGIGGVVRLKQANKI